MIKLLSLCLSLFFLLTGCASQPSPQQFANAYYGPPPKNYEVAIKQYMQTFLKDPYSAQYQFAGPSKGWQSYFGQSEFGWRICAYINAKNSFGGYVGAQPNVFVIRDERVVMAITAQGSGDYDLARAIAEKGCASVLSDSSPPIDVPKSDSAWIGVHIQTVTNELAENLGLPKPMGALVAGVTEGGPAEKGGILPGDVITKFDGKDVADMRRLPQIVGETPIGKEVLVNLWRAGKTASVKLKVEILNDKVPPTNGDDNIAMNAVIPGASAVLGMTLSAPNPQTPSGPAINGVLVTQIASDSPARNRGLNAGDLILEVAGKKVDSPTEVIVAVNNSKTEKRKSVIFLIQGKTGKAFVVVPLAANQ